MVLNLLIIILFFAKVSSSMMVNYVKPLINERASPCSNMQRPCLTLNEYASNSDEYFGNNTRFYFYPSIHRLKYTLNLVNLHNVSFLGRTKSIYWLNGDEVVTIAVDSSSSVGITCNESWNIEISLIMFALHGNFTFIMRFEYSQSVRLSNISIYGNGYSVCSSIISKKSSLEFNNSKFIGINGYVGAALMMYASNITFRGSIMFANNTAASGGSIYLTHNSTLSLKGTSLFRNNTSNFSQEVMNNRKILSCNNINSMREIKLTNSTSNGSGGAIVCNNSYLDIHYYSNFTHNIAGQHGGAMALYTCVLDIQGNTSFVRNKALYYGGAIALLNTNSNINGSLILNKNLANRGGALSIIVGNFIIKGYTLFNVNHAEDIGGGSISCRDSTIIFIGMMYFCNEPLTISPVAALV